MTNRPNRRSVPWDYPLVRTNADREFSRVGVSPDRSYELVGFDGSVQGGLRPFPGFKNVYTLAASDSSNGNQDANHDGTSRLLDLYPISMFVGTEDYAYGFVYRLKRSQSNTSGDTTSADVFVDLWNSKNDTTSFGTEATKLFSDISDTAQMDVSVSGKYVFVFIEGQTPVMFFWNTNTNTLQIEDSPGPGKRPILKDYEDWDAVLGNMDSIEGYPDRPAEAQLILTPHLPSTLDIYPEFPGDVDQGAPEGGVSESPIRITEVSFQKVGGESFAVFEFMNTAPFSVQAGSFLFEWQIAYTNTNAPNSDSQYHGVMSMNIEGGEGDIWSPGEIRSFHSKPSPTTDFPASSKLPDSQLPDNATNWPFARVNSLWLAIKGFYNQKWRLLDFMIYGGHGNFEPQTDADNNIINLPNGENIKPTVDGYWSGNVIQTIPEAEFEVFPNETSAISSGEGLTRKSLKLDIVSPFPHQNSHWTWALPSIELPVGLNAGETNPQFSSGELPALSSGQQPGQDTLQQTSGGADSSGFLTPSERDEETHFLEPGDYTFGYILHDTRTGRKSAFSDISQVRGEDFKIQAVPESTDGVPTEFSSLFASVEMVIDKDKFDQIWFYRSVKTQDAGGVKVSGIKHLDQIVDVADYETLNSPVDDTSADNLGHVLYYYKLEDKQLIHQPVWVDVEVFDEKVPSGGASLHYENTMIISKISNTPEHPAGVAQPEDSQQGVGEIRWSTLGNSSPELFPPRNRKVPSVPSNEPFAYRQVGPNVIGFAKDRMFHIRKEATSLAMQEMHISYGLSSQRGVGVIGSIAYLLTDKGVKQIDSRGQLDDVRVMNYIVLSEWAGNLGNVSMAYDQATGVLMVFNPDVERMALLWSSTGMLTELDDCNYVQVAQGVWPSDLTDLTSSLVERGFMVREPPIHGHLDAQVTDGTHRVYVIDHQRTKTVTKSLTSAFNGEPRITQLDTEGDSRVTVDNITPITDNASIRVNMDDSVDEESVRGAWAYVIEAAKSAALMQRFRLFAIKSAGSNKVTFSVHPDDDSALANLSVGDRIAISPILCRWSGGGVNPAFSQRDPFGQTTVTNFHSVKKIDTIACAFTNVSGPPVSDDDSSTDAKFEGLVFAGADTDPTYSRFPRDHTSQQNTAPLVRSIIDNQESKYRAALGESSNLLGIYGVPGNALAPGVRIACPDLDFRLIAVRVAGRISGTEVSDL